MAVRRSALVLVRVCCSAAACMPRSSLRPMPISRRATSGCSPTRRTRRPRSRRRISAHIVDYHRAEAPGSIVVDSDARYLYYVLPNRKAIRYGVTVGEDALSFWGIARVGRKEEWPRWVPTADIKRRVPRSSGSRRRRTGQSARRARHLSVPGQPGHAVPHPRHQPARIYRAGDLLGLHPHDQRGRDRPLQPREDGRDRRGAGAPSRATRRSTRASRATRTDGTARSNSDGLHGVGASPAPLCVWISRGRSTSHIRFISRRFANVRIEDT